MRKFEKTKIEVIENSEIKPYNEVYVKKMNNITEIKYVKNTSASGLQTIRKLNQNEYCLLETGEVKEYIKSENRSQNTAGLKDSFRKIRDLINNNFYGAKNELCITLTYGTHVTDNKQLLRDFDVFMHRFKRRYSDIDYLNVVEPQGSGRWHCHLLIRFNDRDKIYIPNEELKDLWGKGWVTVKSMGNCDNIGAYLTAYLADIECTPEALQEQLRLTGDISQIRIKTAEIIDDTGQKQTKSFIKGGRLHYYPPGMNLYRKSKGILHPEVEKMKYREAKKIVQNAVPDFASKVIISDIDEEKNTLELNKIIYEQYNTKRVKKTMENKS